MSSPTDATAPDPDAPIEVSRRRVDQVLVGFGVVATLVLVVAGGLLRWGANFSDDYVHDELSSQNIYFGDAESLKAEGRDDLVTYAGEQVTTGDHAEAYASYIDGHLKGIAGGKTYAEIDDRAAAEAVQQARDEGAPEAEIAKLQETADELKGQRDTLFKGETLRGLLLSAYAWSTVGRIAGITAIVVFVAAAGMAILTVLGVLHLVRTAKD